MTFRIRRLLLFAALAGLLAAGLVSCYHAPVVVAEPSHDRVAQQCHRTIRARVSEGFGGRSDVRFDTPEHYYVSRTIEGVRGGGLRRAGGSRDRIYYNCTVDIHSGRLQTARFRVVEAAQNTGVRSVALCQQKIRDEIAADRGRRGVVKFGAVETYLLSFDEEGVRGDAKLKSGDRWEGVRYECAVDPLRRRVSQAWYRALDPSPLTDARSIELCQRAIASRARAEGGDHTKMSFDTGDAYRISRSEKGVRGKAQLRSFRDREAVRYECTVDAQEGRVTAAHYRPIDMPPPSNQQIVEACQMVMREIVVSDHGRRAEVGFKTAETLAVSNHERRVRGRGSLTIGRDRDPIHYHCTVDSRNAKVSEARYRRIDRPQDLTQRSVELCHEAVRERVTSDREGRTTTVFETSEVYFVSNSQEGVRGEGTVRYGLRGREPIGYDCRVNIRRDHVAETRYRYR